MGHPRAWSAAAAVAVASALLVTLTPSGGSEAQWRESASRSVSGPSSDTFAMTATDVPDNGSTPWPDGRMATSPQITLTNQATRHSSWVNVTSTRVDRVVPTDPNTLLQKMSLAYTFGSGTCATDGQGAYWQARGVGQIADGTTYTRNQAKVGGATLAPGQSRVLCPKVTLDYAGTTAGQRQALLNHAGRAVDITTVVNQRSEAPATWASPDRTVTSRYRIATPTPVKPSGPDVCRKTFSSGSPSAVGLFGGFFWGWPDAQTSSETATPAMAGGWEILRRSSSGTWETWATSEGRYRRIAGRNSSSISDDGQDPNAVRQFKLRGYPFAGDKTRYVESAWIARAYELGTILTSWQCESPLPNPDVGPHNMP